MSAQKSINLTTGEQSNNISNTEPTRTVTEIPSGYLITYKFNFANIYQDEFFPNADEWRLNSYGMIHESAKPSLPIRFEDYIVPAGKKIKVTLVSSKYSDFNAEIAPAKPIHTEEIALTAANIPAISNYNGFYPNKLIDIIGTQYFRNIEIATISISPFQYDKINHRIRANKEISFKIEFENKISPQSIENDIDEEGRLKFQLNTPNMSDSNGAGTVYTNPSGPTGEENNLQNSQYIIKDYLIISVPEFKSAIDKLCEWKRMLGYSVFTEYRNDWTTENIKSAISEFASSHPNFTHLLFVGGSDRVPSLSYYSPINGAIYYSDMGYACLNGINDIIPDVIYGRIPANSLEDITTIIDKSINYEKNPLMNDSYYNNHLFAALFYDPIPENSTKNVRENINQYTETCEIIRTKLSEKGYNTDFAYKLIPANQSLIPTYWFNGNLIPEHLRMPTYNWSGCASNINNSINNGVSTILYRGHGNINSWWQMYGTSDINGLNNQDRTPIVFSLACKTGQIKNGTSFAETFLKIKGGGCSAIIAATENSYTILNNYYAKGIYESIWPDNINTSPTYEIGAVMQTAYNISGHFIDYDFYQRSIYHCYGDPSMRIYASKPKDVENVTVTRAKTKISVSTETPMYISIYNPDTKETVLTYGTKFNQFYAQDLDGNIDTDTQSLKVTVYNNNYKPKTYVGLKLRPGIPFDPILSLDNCELYENEMLKVDFTLSEEIHSANIVISDIYGSQKISKQCSSTDSSTLIDVSSLNRGVYIISLEVNRCIIGSRRIIK